jgi:hypothetical protein
VRLLPFAAALLLGVAARAEAPTWEDLEARGARIASVEVRIENVFDLSDPAQDTWIGRLANTLHITTREAVIRRTLTFAVGDPVDAQRIHEVERTLRAYRFLKDAHIDPELRPDGSVVAVVRVRDAWTLKLSVGYSHVGNQSSLGCVLRDRNFLGTGKDLGMRRERGVDQASTTFLYRDRQLFGSRWTLTSAYQSLSDGWGRSLGLSRPFFSTDTPWSVGVSGASTARLLRVYDRQALVYTAPSLVTRGALSAAWMIRRDVDSVLRLGMRVEASDARYGPLSVQAPPGTLPPPDLVPRRLRGAAVTLEWLQDGFRTFRNLQGMDTPEDYNLGWSGHVAAGLYSRAWGSTGTGPCFRADLSKGWALGSQSLILAQGAGAGRVLDGRFENGIGTFSLTGYRWGPAWQVLAINVTADAALRADPENVLYLGGLEGMRGYPNNMHPGSARWILSLEDRFLTEWRWLGMLRAGFVVYADAGAIRRLDGTGWTRPYSDVGAGLRFGDLKSSLGRVVLLTVAVPTVREPGQNRYQVLVGNVVRF